MGFFGQLPDEGPSESSLSEYYYSCSLRISENDILDRVVLLLAKGQDWNSASLLSHIQGKTFEGAQSPWRFTHGTDRIVFTMPVNIRQWNRRPETIYLMVEAGYERFTEEGMEDLVYFDRMPEEGQDLVAISIPSETFDLFPVALVGMGLGISSIATYMFLRRHRRPARRFRQPFRTRRLKAPNEALT